MHHEHAVPTAQQGVFPECGVAVFEIGGEPVGRSSVLVLLQITVGDVQRNHRRLLLAIQGGGIVQVGEHLQGHVILPAPVISLGEPVSRHLVEICASVRVVGGSPQTVHRSPPRAAGHELGSPEIIGFHVVRLHVAVELVYLVIGIYRSGVIPPVEGCKGDVAVYLGTSALVGILPEIFLEHR